MKKSIFVLALMAALNVQATELAPAAPAATDVPAVVPVAQAAVTPATPKTLVNVSGASTIAGAPLLLSVNGAKLAEPGFPVLFDAVKTYPTWKVASVKNNGTTSRVSLLSAKGKAQLEMDMASSFVAGLRIAKGTVITVETQSSGEGALIKFVKDKTPVGFMVNQNTKVTSP